METYLRENSKLGLLMCCLWYGNKIIWEDMQVTDSLAY